MGDFRYSHRQPTTLASGQPLTLGDVVADDALADEDRWLVDDARLVPVEDSEIYPDAPEELSGEALKQRAKELGVEGYSNMKADELRAAVAEKEQSA